MNNFIKLKLKSGEQITMNLNNVITAKYDKCSQINYTNSFTENTMVKYIDGSYDNFSNEDAKIVYKAISKIIDV